MTQLFDVDGGIRMVVVVVFGGGGGYTSERHVNGLGCVFCFVDILQYSGEFLPLAWLHFTARSWALAQLRGMTALCLYSVVRDQITGKQ